jgi:hypothetical protein
MKKPTWEESENDYKEVTADMNKTKPTKIEGFLCCMCHKTLGVFDSLELVPSFYICVNPVCPNYSLLCIPEELMIVRKKGLND